MEYKNSHFKFNVPDNWIAFNEGKQQVFQFNDGVELILSTYSVDEKGQETNKDEKNAIRNELVEKSLTAAKNAASHSELKIVRPLRKEILTNGIEVWKLGCEVINEEFIFEQAVFATDSAVLFVTFESPKIDEYIEAYNELTLSVNSNM